MNEIPNKEPAIIVAGDTVKWTKSLPNYPATSYDLKYVLNFKSSVQENPIEIVAAADDDDFSVSVAASVTKDYGPGEYIWTSYATDKATGDERYTVDSGNLEIKPDPTNIIEGTDLRSHAKIVLDAIEATLENTATSDQKNILISGKMIQRYSVGELLELRDRYQADVRREEDAEKVANGMANGRQVLTRFRK
jgi:hypothetical protein